jgi:hypothetical protein
MNGFATILFYLLHEIVFGWPCVSGITERWYTYVRVLWIEPNQYTVLIYTYSFSIALPAHSGPRSLIQFRNHFSQMVGLLGRVISPSQGRYLHTGQHKHRINAYPHKHPCFKWDSSPRSQRPSEWRQFMTDRGYYVRPFTLIRPC